MKQIILNYIDVLFIPALIGFIVRFLFRRVKKGYFVTVILAVLTVIGWVTCNIIRTHGSELFGIWALMITATAAASFVTGLIIRKKGSVLPIVLVICIGLLMGALYLFNSAFPKAEPIRHPELEKVISITLSCNTPERTIPMSEVYYKDLIQYISEAKPTRKQTLDDYPSNRPYYGIEVQTTGRQYRYFIYEEGEQIYIEMPYTGIYKSENELLDLVLTFFTEG